MKSRGEALREYVIRRILLMIPTFIGITFLTFLVLQFVPGGQIDQLRMQLAGAGGGGETSGGGGARTEHAAAAHTRELSASLSYSARGSGLPAIPAGTTAPAAIP